MRYINSLLTFDILTFDIDIVENKIYNHFWSLFWWRSKLKGTWDHTVNMKFLFCIYVSTVLKYANGGLNAPLLAERVDNVMCRPFIWYPRRRPLAFIEMTTGTTGNILLPAAETQHCIVERWNADVIANCQTNWMRERPDYCENSV